MYEEIGNISNYSHEPKIVKSEGLINTSHLNLKFYSMFPQNASMDISPVRRFVTERIHSGDIKPYLGMGFAIVSPEYLNVSVWGAGHSVIVKNELYHFTADSLSDARKLDLNQDGPYCLFEAKILGYESELWSQFLRSLRREEDKQQYLSTCLEKVLE